MSAGVSGGEPMWSGAPAEFPPGFAEFQRLRRGYLRARRAEAERRCAEQSLRDALSSLPDEIVLVTREPHHGDAD